MMLKRVLGIGETVFGVVEFCPQATLLVFGVRDPSEEAVALLDMRLLDVGRLRLFFAQLPRERVGVRLRLGQDLAKRIGFERPAVVQLEELVVLVRLRLSLGRILQRALGEILALSSQVVQLVSDGFELFLREPKRVFELVDLCESGLILLVLPDEVPDACLARRELGLELEELTLGVHQGFFDRCRLALGVGGQGPLRRELGAKRRQLFRVLRVDSSRRKRLMLVLKLLDFALQSFASRFRVVRTLLKRLVDSLGPARWAYRLEFGLEFLDPIFRKLELSLRFVAIEQRIFKFALRCRLKQTCECVRRG